jgi:ribosomal protein L37AE/L43A
MTQYPIEPVQRSCSECGSRARTIRLRSGAWVCGCCLHELRLNAARAFVHPRDVAKVVGPPTLFD